MADIRLGSGEYAVHAGDERALEYMDLTPGQAIERAWENLSLNLDAIGEALGRLEQAGLLIEATRLIVADPEISSDPGRGRPPGSSGGPSFR